MVIVHNLFRWIVLILAILTVIKSFSGMSSKKAFTPADKKTPLFFMISMDIQLLLGLLVFFTGTAAFKNIQNNGMGNVMKDSVGRFFTVEHTSLMLVAIIFAHLAFAATKKSIADTAKFKRIFIFSLLSLLTMLAAIPWPFYGTIGRPFFPGM